MIVNLPAHGGNALLTMDASQGQCDYNFLKRKLDAEDNHPINNEEGNITSASYQVAASPNDNSWKKRYVVHDSSTSSNNTANCYIANNFNSNPLTEFRNGSEQATALNSSSAADMAFNLIGSSSFINDLFAYDANLIVPVSASFVSLSPICGSESTAISPAFVAPTSVCVNPSYDDGSSWQATDLLELDHRYNSGLQTDITDLNPTVTLKHTQSVQPLSPTQSQPESARQQESSSPLDFLVPSTQKQVFRPQSNKYRQQLQPPAHLSSDPESDLEDKNLSWLLNFKFDELPHLSPDVGANNTTNNSAHSAANASNNNIFSPLSSNKSDSSSPASACTAASNTHLSQSERSCSPKTSNKVGRKFEELVMEVTSEVDSADMSVPENVVVEDSSSRTSKKPPFTYTELIEYALEDKGELTVSGIYQWISDRFPYYKSNDDRWKNSVRHNLSINPHFRKGVKAPQGAGHLWTISSGDSAENVLAWEHKKQRLDLFFKMESMNRERLQQHQLQLQQQQQQQQCVSPQQQRANGQDCPPEQCGYDEAAIAAANITREMLSASTTHNALNCTHNESAQAKPSIRHVVHELPFNDIMSDEELRKTAGQILNGIHREVEVQSVNSISTYQDVLLDSEDYLNPIHKDVAVHESGLRNTLHSHLHPHVHFHSHGSSSSSQYYVTEIDPLELGIQMTHQVAEVEPETDEVLFSDEFNLNYFGCNAGSDIVA